MLTQWNPHSKRGPRDTVMYSTHSSGSKKPFMKFSSHSQLTKSYRTPTSSAPSTNSSTNDYTSPEQWTLALPDTPSGATSQSWSKTSNHRLPGFGTEESYHSNVNFKNPSTHHPAASASGTPPSTTTNSRRIRHTGSTRTITTTNQPQPPAAPATDEDLHT